MKLNEQTVIEEGFKKIANYLLANSIRKHNKFYPCC